MKLTTLKQYGIDLSGTGIRQISLCRDNEYDDASCRYLVLIERFDTGKRIVEGVPSYTLTEAKAKYSHAIELARALR